MRGNKPPYPIWIKFCMVVAIPDVITYANFGEDRLTGVGVAVGQSFPFSIIDFDRRPYMCVIFTHFISLEFQMQSYAVVQY